MQLDSSVMTSVEVLDEGFEGPLSAEGPLDLYGSLLAHSEVIHDLLASSFEPETLLDSHDNFEELGSVLHDAISPALATDVVHYHALDGRSGGKSLLVDSQADLAPQCRLQESCLICAAPVQC